MAAPRITPLSIIFFALRFLVLACICVVGVWYSLAVYGWLLAQFAGVPLRLIFGIPITGITIETGGFLNTGSTLAYDISNADEALPVALARLSSSLGTYLALILATLGISWRRRLLSLAVGSLLIFLSQGFLLMYMTHVLYDQALSERLLDINRDVPALLVQFNMFLPFVLWLLLAYWERLRGWMDEG